MVRSVYTLQDIQCSPNPLYNSQKSLGLHLKDTTLPLVPVLTFAQAPSVSSALPTSSLQPPLRKYVTQRLPPTRSCTEQLQSVNFKSYKGGLTRNEWRLPKVWQLPSQPTLAHHNGCRWMQRCQRWRWIGSQSHRG